MARRDWTEGETMAAFALLYMVLEPREYRASNPDIIQLARAIGRGPDAVKMKIENLKRGDPNRIAAGQSGLPHGAALELEMWRRFDKEGDGFLVEALGSFSDFGCGFEFSADVRYTILEMPPEGKEAIAERVVRVNHKYFRNSLLSNYRGRCCVTGLATPKLLVASHIKPWADSDPKAERLAASNGLLLNALHDRAFDQGLMTIDTGYKVRFSSKVKREEAANGLLLRFEGQKIELPVTMPPAREFIEYHNDVIFVA